MPELPALLRLSVDPLDLIIRGTAVYWFLFALFRFVLRREAGSIAIADIMLLVLVADASQNAMSGGYQTLADGAVLVLTLVGWNYLIDWASFHSAAVRRIVEPPALLLVKNGCLVRANLRREMVTLEELHAALREHGIESVGDVKAARMESDGRITVTRRGAAPTPAAPAVAPVPVPPKPTEAPPPITDPPPDAVPAPVGDPPVPRPAVVGADQESMLGEEDPGSALDDPLTPGPALPAVRALP